MNTEPGKDQREMSLIGHLLELRDRLMRAVLAVLLVFLALLPFQNQLYHVLALPLLSHMPVGTHMIATGVASPFLAPMKLAGWTAFFVCVPFVLYQVWSFIAPGLYRHERVFALPLLVSSVLLFYAGMAFAYFVVFPLAFGFLTTSAPEGVQVMTDIDAYLSFVLMSFLAFGVTFEAPAIVVLLVATGLVSTESLIAKRPYIIVLCFVVGMVLSPPDVLSQFLLAVPMWLLFEAGLVVARIIEKRRARRDAAAG